MLKERLIIDQIMLEVDPGARSKMRRRERDLKRAGRPSFWPAGTPLSRAKMPDFSTAFGE
jgi:hypothetical protein